jgi:hypothetical protein
LSVSPPYTTSSVLVRPYFTILVVPFVSHCSSVSISKQRCKSRADDLLGRAFSPEQRFVLHTAAHTPSVCKIFSLTDIKITPVGQFLKPNVLLGWALR